MTKIACAVLAASLIFPLLASHAVPPGSAEQPHAGAEKPPVTPADPAAELFSPEELAALQLELQDALIDAFLAAESGAGKMIVVSSAIHRLSDVPRGLCLAGGGPGEDLCAAARRISHQRPCLASSSDCPALDEWRRVMGEPGVRPAPRSTVQAAVPSAVRIERPAQD